MKEANPISKENRSKPSKFSDQNQAPKSNPKGVSTNSSKLRSASSWGSHIVKGLAGERKSKLQPTTIPTKKSQSNPLQSINNSNNKIKRGLIGELSCSVAAIQVHPQTLNSPNNASLKFSGSRDLLVEIENLRALLKESKEREFQLQSELSESRRNQRILELEREFEAKENEVQGLLGRIGLLESERTTLREQLKNLSCDPENRENEVIAKTHKPQSLEMEVVKLRRLNKELQLQKRDLACKVASMDSQLACSAKSSESEIITKIKAEASMLRHTNEDLSKQVEGLQMNRLNEVEELAYLRWVNAQLRNELRNSCSCTISDVGSSPCATEMSQTPGFPRVSDDFLECSSAKRVTLVKKLNKWPVTDEDLSSLGSPSHSVIERRWDELVEGNSATRRHSISGSKCSDDDLVVNKRRQSDGFICSKEAESKEENRLNSQKHEASKLLVPMDVEKRALRVPNPPPRPSCANSTGPKEAGSTQAPPAPPPPPPPPPPPRFSALNTSGAVQRAPQVVEFYHSLMKRDTRRDSSAGAICDAPNVANVKSSMIGEIENRSSYLLAIKADVETQGDFVNSLIREVNNAVYRDIEDVVAFVKWLDDELCFLVDERAVLKHFDWPEKKADALREAAFGYKDLKKLESEVTYYHDDPRLPCDVALKKMVSLSEKIECTVYNLLRTRDSLMRSCKEFQIPIDWMLDRGIISKVKIGSVKLAKKYMNRVATELQLRSSLEKDTALDYMLLQGVRFAFRIHQFAGGFDAETMEAFEELRRLAHALHER